MGIFCLLQCTPGIGQSGYRHIGCFYCTRSVQIRPGSEVLQKGSFVPHRVAFDAQVNGKLHGASITFDFPSVGATENVMMAAVRAEGHTTIDNAAREPEIADLANMLVEMGAKISGQGTPTIEVDGVDELHPVDHRTVGDRIEAGTYLVAGALMGGPLTTVGADPAHLTLALEKLRRMGVSVETGPQTITVSRTGDLQPCDIQTLPHPGFPKDLQAQFMVLAALAKGSSVITENVFENRFMFASELSRMGADVRIEGHHAHWCLPAWLPMGRRWFPGSTISIADTRIMSDIFAPWVPSSTVAERNLAGRLTLKCVRRPVFQPRVLEFL